MEMSNSLVIQNVDRFRIVTFNRPQIRNPLSINVVDQLQVVVRQAGDTTTVDTLIFTGRDGVFASGADLREIAEVTPDGAREFAVRGQALMNSIAGLKIETVAAIDGFCFGGALDLALACRKRIASPRSMFAHPGVGLGIITGWGGTQRLPRLIGQANAMEMFLTAAPVDADTALRMGLVDEIAEDPLDQATGSMPETHAAI